MSKSGDKLFDIKPTETHPYTVSNILFAFQHNAHTHIDSVKGKTDLDMLRMLIEEVGEAAAAINGDHEDPVELELQQIGGIVLNWWLMRYCDRKDAI